MALGLAVANDIADAALTFYVRGKALAQTIQDKPLLAWLRSGMESFPGGKDYISEPIQGAFMSDAPGFLQGYSEDDQLTFAQASNLVRVQAPWKEMHAGLIISWTELKKDGITVTDNQKTSEHSRVELTRLTGILKNRLDDYGESWSRVMNLMLWRDGTQDAKLIPGVRSILTDTPAVGVCHGLNRANYPYWRHRAAVGAGKIVSSPANQTLSKFLRQEVRQLRRFGGKPNKIFAGSGAIANLESEIVEKGQYTVEGFMKESATNLGVADITVKGVGKLEYDPTMDDEGLANFMVFMDSRRLKLRPMEGEDNKLLTPTRPHDYLVFLKSMTFTGGLMTTQLNAMAIYETA